MLELASIIILGIMAQWLAWRFKIPAILPLIFIGLMVGPLSTLISEDGYKWLEPVWDGEKGLFPGERLFNFVSLAISLILFEGGLTLKKEEVKNVGPVIYRLITIGPVITLFVAGISAHYIMGLTWSISFLFSSLIIVTGPTVISPILRNLAIKKDISTILKWEGILIDPIGALVAVLVFEFISVGEGQGSTYTKEALIEFGKTIVIGFSIGFSFAHAFAFALRKKWIPHYLMNVIALALVLGVFVLSDFFAHESGLLAVVIMGMVLGNMNVEGLKEVLYFKESISILLISMLFILLSAHIDLEDLKLVFSWESLALFAVIILIARPLGVFISTNNSNIRLNEKLFISWVGPRGIVAAGIASLFGLKLTMQGVEDANYITPLVFMIVLGTVLLNATTARLFAKYSGVLLQKTEGILIIGASNPARLIAKYLQDSGRRVVMVDSNPKHIENARNMGIEAHKYDIHSDELIENVEFNDIGYIIALTASDSINQYAINKLKKHFGKQGAFRLINAGEMRNHRDLPKETLFSSHDDYLNISEVTRDYPAINEAEITSKEQYLNLIEILQKEKDTIPLFIRDLNNEIQIIPSNYKEISVEPGYKLMYLGKEVQTEEDEKE